MIFSKMSSISLTFSDTICPAADTPYKNHKAHIQIIMYLGRSRIALEELQ